MPHPPLHPTLPLPPHSLSQTKNSTPSNTVKLIGLAILDKPLYPQVILVLTKHASIATAWDISASIVNSTPVLLASAMPLIMSRIAAHSATATTRLVPYLPHLLCPTILPLLLDQSIQYPLRWQTGSLLPPLNKPSVDPIALTLPPHASTPLPSDFMMLVLPPFPSDFTMLVLPPLVQTTMMSMTLMLGITSMESRIFQWCLNATMEVMLRSPISFFLFPFSFFLSLVLLCSPFVSLLAECLIPASHNSLTPFHSDTFGANRSFPRIFSIEYSFVLLNLLSPSLTFHSFCHTSHNKHI